MNKRAHRLMPLHAAVVQTVRPPAPKVDVDAFFKEKMTPADVQAQLKAVNARGRLLLVEDIEVEDACPFEDELTVPE